MAFAETHFLQAGLKLRQGAFEKAESLGQQIRAISADRELSGDCFYLAWAFQEALAEYEKAHRLLNIYQHGLDASEMRIYPEYSTDVQRLLEGCKCKNIIRNAGRRARQPKTFAGVCLGVPEVNLAEPEIFQSPGLVQGPDRFQAWPGLGVPQQGGAEGTRRLEEAIEAARLALSVRSRGEQPQDWAAAQITLGRALVSMEGRQTGAEAAGRSRKRNRPFVRRQPSSRDDFPLGWAETQHELGSELETMGERQSGAGAARRFERGGPSRPTALPRSSLATTFPSPGPRLKTPWAARLRGSASAALAAKGCGG